MTTIDADAHVVESERTWDYIDKADQKYRPLIVKPRGEGGGEFWYIDGKIRGLVRIVLTAQHVADVAQRTGRDMNTPQETREMENVAARLKHMDELGIDVQVLYPTMFIEQIADKPEWEIPISKGYNRWLADIHAQGQGRLRWICVLPLLDMSAALEELKFCAQHGSCGVFMRGIEGQRMITDPYFYPLYEEMSRLNLAVGVHVGNANPYVLDLVSQYNGGGSFWKFRIPVIGAFHSVVMSDVPKLFQAALSLGRSRRAVDSLRRQRLPAPLGRNQSIVAGKPAQRIPPVCVMPNRRRRRLRDRILRRRKPRHRHRLRSQRPIHRNRSAAELEKPGRHHAAAV